LIAPATIQVTPVASGLAFGVDVSADTGQLLEILFGYDVVNPAITAASLSLDGAFAAADGAVTAAKTFCEGGTFDPGSVTGCTGTQDGLIAFALDGLTDLNESLAILPATSFLSVVDDIAVDGGLIGNASLTGSVINQFPSATPVPEPATSVLVATGILGLLRARARPVGRRPS
jgi:hypothetical protein